MNWRKKKFTFVVIPDANSSVLRFQLSAVMIVIGFVLIALLVAACVISYMLYKEKLERSLLLESELSAATGRYETIIAGKNDHIDELQSEVIDLSAQAQSITSRIAGMKELESELKQLVGLAPAPDEAVQADAASDGGAQYAMDGGTGGEEIPVSEADMLDLAEQVSDRFLVLGKQLEKLRPALELTREAVEQQLALLRVTPTIWPVDSRRITSEFGIRKDPFTRRATFHAGIDIGADTGDAIYAAADGTVAAAGYDSAHGYNVLISHTNGLLTHYSHMRKILTEVSAQVHKGDIIGTVGSTGRSTGPHLHYEVIVNGDHVDPMPYLKSARRSG